MNAPPSTLMDELDRDHAVVVDRAHPEPPLRPHRAGDGGGDAGRQLRRRAVRGEPAAADLGHQGADGRPRRWPTPRHRALLLLDLYATVLVLAAIGMTLVFVRNFDVARAVAAEPLLARRHVGDPGLRRRVLLPGVGAPLGPLQLRIDPDLGRDGRQLADLAHRHRQQLHQPHEHREQRRPHRGDDAARLAGADRVGRVRQGRRAPGDGDVLDRAGGQGAGRAADAVRAQPERAGRAVQRRGREARSPRSTPASGRWTRARRHASSAAQLQRDLQIAAAQAVGRLRAAAQRRAPAARAAPPRRASASARPAAPRRRRARSSAPTARHRCRNRPDRSIPASNNAMRILVIGGGVFLGASIVDSRARARPRGSRSSTAAARAATGRAGVEAIVGDRCSDLGAARGPALRCRHRHLRLRAGRRAAPAPPRCASCGRYCFVSSISAYASFTHAPVRESDALAASDGIAEDDADRARHYGPQKAACERVVAAAFGERALIVRPGLIVGPGDRTGRFSYWPWRALAGGEILVPDVSGDEPIQLIDVRDLADWIVRAVEAGASGAFNATGPQDGRACGWPEVLEACIDAARRRGGAPLRFVPVGEAYLVEQGVAPWNELPLWVPSTDAGAPRLRPRRLQPRGRRRPRHAAARRDRRRGPRRVRHARRRRPAPARQAHARPRARADRALARTRRGRRRRQRRAAMRTQVAIVGAGPAGLLLGAAAAPRPASTTSSSSSAAADYVLGRIRAGVLEQVTVDLLDAAGVGARMHAEGLAHDGIELCFGGARHRIDLHGLTGGKQVMVYGQTEVTRDLMAARAARRRCRPSTRPSDVSLHDFDGDAPARALRARTARRTSSNATSSPAATATTASAARACPPARSRTYERVYPFGWLGVLADTPPVSHELIYVNHERGFALCSMRSRTRSRYYVQCPLDEQRRELARRRVLGRAARAPRPRRGRDALVTGPSIEKSIAPLRSFVAEPMRFGRLFLAGDAAPHRAADRRQGPEPRRRATCGYLSRALDRALPRARATPASTRYSDALPAPRLAGRALLVVVHLADAPASRTAARSASKMQEAELDYLVHSRRGVDGAGRELRRPAALSVPTRSSNLPGAFMPHDVQAFPLPRRRRRPARRRAAASRRARRRSRRRTGPCSR